MNSTEKKRLEGLLKPYRAEERKAHLATMIDDTDAIRVLAAWGSCRSDWKPEGATPRDEGERWRWLWSCVWFDREELAARSKLSETQVERLLRVCVGARVAYPDGNISKYARILVEDFVRARSPGHQRGRPKGTKDKVKRKKRGSDDDE